MMYKNAMLKDNQIANNMKRKAKITDQSNFHTPLELCLRLQYRASRKQITKTDYSVQKPVDRVYSDDDTLEPENGGHSPKQKDRSIAVEVKTTPSKVNTELKPTVTCNFDSNYKIISYNFQKSSYADSQSGMRP